MNEISTDVIKEAVYNLCYSANTCLNADIYNKILNAYNETTCLEEKNILGSILQNAKIAFDKKRPLCQDTGQVLVFLETGQDAHIKGEFIETAINEAVEKCYKENCFRKSVVKNAVSDRTNTKTNTPAIIYTKYVQGDEIKINVLIKGAGSENKSLTKMMLPTVSKEELISEIGNMILTAGVNACPPMFIGIGTGGTLEKAALMSKEVFFEEGEDKELTDKIKKYVNENAPRSFKNNYVLDIKLKSASTHIACMPVAVTINCHSDRMSSCKIVSDKEIIYTHKVPEFIEIKNNDTDKKEIFAADTTAIRTLKEGENILLTGEIYVARDMAHKKLKEMLDNGEKLPLEIKDKIIFYAGPCPAKPGEIIGSIGPTTAGRMDKYATDLYKMGLLATIGKGNRSEDVIHTIKENHAKYFTVTGGVAALLSDMIKKSEIVAFEELGAEALYKLYVEKLPLKVEIG